MSPIEKTKTTKRVFLSYIPEDKAVAQELRKILSNRSDVRLFTHELLSVSEHWQTKIKQEIQKCEVFIVILSPESLMSEWVLQEIGAAWGMNKRIIPIATHPAVVLSKPAVLNEIPLKELEDFKDLGKLNQILNDHPVAMTR